MAGRKIRKSINTPSPPFRQTSLSCRCTASAAAAPTKPVWRSSLFFWLNIPRHLLVLWPAALFFLRDVHVMRAIFRDKCVWTAGSGVYLRVTLSMLSLRCGFVYISALKFAPEALTSPPSYFHVVNCTSQPRPKFELHASKAN